MKLLGFVFTLSLILNGSYAFAASPAEYEVKEMDHGSTLETLGIKPGDRIISYNGKKVVSINDTMDLYDKMKSNSVKKIVIERDGKKKTLTYQIR